MNMRKWTEDYINSAVKKGMPILSFPGIQITGITVEQLVKDSELQAQTMQAVAERTDSAASVSMMDLSVEAEAFGSQIITSATEVPTVVGAIVRDMDAANALRVPEVGEGRTGIYLDALSKATKLITDRPVFCGVIGPFSLAGRILGVSDIMVDCYMEPELVETVMEKTTQFLIKYITEYKKTGAAGVCMAEPLTGLLSPALAEGFSAPYVKRIVDAVQDDSFAVIYHNCGNNTMLMMDSILTAGAMGYHFGDAISMKEAVEKVPSDVLVMGNVSPSEQFLSGTPESMRGAVLGLMNECCVGHDNFIISSGCDIPPASKWENIDAFFAAVAEYYGAK